MASSKPTFIFYTYKNPFLFIFLLKTLSNDLGCFPFDKEPLRSIVCLFKKLIIFGV